MEFNVDEARKKYELSDEDFFKKADEIFGQLALTATAAKGTPKFIIVGGQAGSGKTSLVAKKNSELKENAIIIDQDEIRASYPSKLYEEIVENHDDREEYLILKPFVLKMRQEIVNRALNGGYNVIMESAMQAVDSFIAQADQFKTSGYETELSVISVPEADCFLSTLNRYCYYLEKDGICRRNTKNDPEMLKKLRRNIVKLEDTGLFDNIDIHIRGEEANVPPRKIYSKKENSNETPLQAFDRGQVIALKTTGKTFDTRAQKIRMVLEQYDETEKLGQLDEIERQYNSSLGDRGDLDG